MTSSPQLPSRSLHPFQCNPLRFPRDEPPKKERRTPRKAKSHKVKYEPRKPRLIWIDEAERDSRIKYRAFNRTIRELKKAEYTRKVNELADLAGCP